jgi:hypothetical protein
MNLKLKLKVYGALCQPADFEINDIKADLNDFGEKYDRDPENAPDYGCGNMQFTGNNSTPEILTKYSITQSEYEEIVSQLSEKLSFGLCDMCI